MESGWYLMMLDQEEINQYLRESLGTCSLLIPRLYLFDCLDSTNTWLKQRGACGDVCIAEQQTKGRGRRGKRWLSPNAENIYLSLKWCFKQTPVHLSLLSLVVGLSIVKALQKMGLSGHGVKWPNDIYWQGLKMGGILIESVSSSVEASHPSGLSLIIGIGLNINMSIAEGEQIDQPWISLSKILGKRINRNQLLALLLEHLINDLQCFNHLDLEQFQKKWQQWDVLYGQQVRVLQQHKELSGIVRGLDKQGRIAIELMSGQLTHYSSAEIRLKKGNI